MIGSSSSGAAEAADSFSDHHHPLGDAVAGEEEEAPTPLSADLSLDTPKSYMSATGELQQLESRSPRAVACLFLRAC